MSKSNDTKHTGTHKTTTKTPILSLLFSHTVFHFLIISCFLQSPFSPLPVRSQLSLQSPTPSASTQGLRVQTTASLGVCNVSK